MNRAYSILEVKNVSEEERVIEGIASTPKVDRAGDVVEPLGARYALPMPLLLDHNSREQVGHVEFAKPTAKGIPFKARIAKVEEPGEVKDLVDKAWHLVKYKLRAAVSIGFRAFEGGYEVMKSGGYRFTEWEWLELSLVSVPAQDEAVITSAKGMDDACLRLIKSVDQELRAAAGVPEPVIPEIPTEESATPAAKGNEVRVVRLVDPARDRAKPFVIRSIKR